jgi:hypothetical protein
MLEWFIGLIINDYSLNHEIKIFKILLIFFLNKCRNQSKDILFSMIHSLMDICYLIRLGLYIAEALISGVFEDEIFMLMNL